MLFGNEGHDVGREWFHNSKTDQTSRNKTNFILYTYVYNIYIYMRGYPEGCLHWCLTSCPLANPAQGNLNTKNASKSLIRDPLGTLHTLCYSHR